MKILYYGYNGSGKRTTILNRIKENNFNYLIVDLGKNNNDIYDNIFDFLLKCNFISKESYLIIFGLDKLSIGNQLRLYNILLFNKNTRCNMLFTCTYLIRIISNFLIIFEKKKIISNLQDDICDGNFKTLQYINDIKINNLKIYEKYCNELLNIIPSIKIPKLSYDYKSINKKIINDLSNNSVLCNKNNFEKFKNILINIKNINLYNDREIIIIKIIKLFKKKNILDIKNIYKLFLKLIITGYNEYDILRYIYIKLYYLKRYDILDIFINWNNINNIEIFIINLFKNL